MITRVELKGFQNHKHLALDLGSFTVLSGPSNSGKTAVLRALAAMLRNDSAGDFLPWDGSAKNISVKVFLEDGHEVHWEKGKDNQYTITRPDGKVSAYKKVGASVPEEVMEVLRIGPIVMEDGTKAHVNLHEQQESPFLLMDTPGYVAKVFGELTSAGKLFSAANEGNRRTREEKKLRTLREADITSTQAELTAYEGIAETKERLHAVAEKVSTAGKLSKAHNELVDLANGWEASQEGIKTADQAIKRLSGVEKIDIGVISQLNTASTQLEELSAAHQLSTETLQELDARLPELERRAGVDLGPLETIEGAIGGLTVLLDARQTISEQIETLAAPSEVAEIDFDTMLKLESAISTITDLKFQYWEAHEAVEVLGGRILTAKSDLKEAQDALAEIDTCPTCGQEITAEAAEHLTGATHG